MGDLSRIESAARRVKEAMEKGDQVVVVVSAMAGMTNDLAMKCAKINENGSGDETATVLAAGEQISAGLMALALEKIGLPSRSWLGWQLPLHTKMSGDEVEIDRMDVGALRQNIENGVVPVVAGFQGIHSSGRISVLGRGGSDTTAVALAIALQADVCDIYTDVPGVYFEDPKKQPNGKKLANISYQDMLAFADKGAKVLEKKSIILAMENHLPLHVLSSFEKTEGTRVSD